MNLTKQQKILIGGGSVLILFIISLIIFLIIHNHKSKTNDECTWSVGDWSPPCSETSKTQTRNVTCKNNQGGDCTTCTANTKPQTTNICQLNCCNKTSWECSISSDGTCPSDTSKTYDCSYCTSNIFPPNVHIFYPGRDKDTQKIINEIFSTQGGTEPPNKGQNSKVNCAFLFMPGIYTLTIPIGFYTHVAGLGTSNDKVVINGGPRVDNGSTQHNVGALNTFWRTCENMTVNPKTTLPGDTQPSMIYAVSQSCSLRSVQVNGILHLSAMEPPSPNGDGGMGFASGGFMANCNIQYDLNMGSQQQFICRNTEYGSFSNFIWNQVNVGCKSDNERKGCCINTTEPQISSTTLTVVDDNTGGVIEKPYLAYDDDDGIVVIYSGQSNTRGNTIFNGFNAMSITSKFYKIVTEDVTARTLNSLLSNNDNICIIFSPGRYNIDTPINLNGQLLFGLGLPVLTSTQNKNIITGYGNICGIIFDAGYSTNGDPSDNILVNLVNPKPSYLWDIVCRVGGGDDHTNTYQVKTMLYIGGDNSILDNVWCWVADHYADDNTRVGWEKAVCQIGVHVTGNKVIAYGLFAEHTRYRNVLWEGDNGEVYMFQSEFNYFFPDNFSTDSLVAYEVTNTVTKHTLKGAGAYSFFPNTNHNNVPPNPTTMALAGFKFADVSKVDYENLTTVFLDGYGGINYVFYDDYSRTGYGQTVQRDSTTNPKDIPKTQVSVICNKNRQNICACPTPDICPQTAPCDTTQGRCKPT